MGAEGENMEKLILTATEAAKALSTTPAKVLELLSEGEIDAYREGRNWKIPKVSLEDYVRERAAFEAAERRRLHEEEIIHGSRNG